MERITWANLTQKRIKVFFLVIHCMDMHIEHIIGDDEVPTGKQVNTELEKKTEEVSKLPKIQSIESRIQSIESGAGTNLINSGLQKE